MKWWALFDPAAPSALNDLNTTNYRMVAFTRMATVVIGVILWAFIYLVLRHFFDTALDLVNSLLLFLGAALGLNVVQYGWKRATNAGYAAAKASGQPTQTVNVQSETANVAAAPPADPVPVGGEFGLRVTAKPKPNPDEPNLYVDNEKGE